MNSSFSEYVKLPRPETTPTSTGTNGVSMGIVIGAAVGGIFSILLALWLGFKYVMPGTKCISCFKDKVVSKHV